MASLNQRNATACQEHFDDGTYPDGFWSWLYNNWHIYDMFVKYSMAAKNKGQERWSARDILHVMRWHNDVMEARSPLKLNDYVSPWLARLAMADIPALNGFFETRSQAKVVNLDGTPYVGGEEK